jgi:predicted O-linked N-acetylglucosamine transferase (SPINDLY family)
VPLPELDYIFCDQIVVPPNLASAYLPEPLYIGENYQANDSKREIGRVMMREEEGLPSDKFIFCCFSNHYKTTEVVFDAWMSILTRADNSILWLVGDNEWARHNMLERASRHGVDPSRIVFARRVGPEDYMSRLRLADLFLDTFPYNAGTVASDAIRMGLPLVTISGQAFASRMAGRLLTAVGGHKGITTSAEEYIDVAVSLATDKASYDTYKACFGSAKWAEGIGDVKRFASDLEHVLASLVAERHSKIAEG